MLSFIAIKKKRKGESTDMNDATKKCIQEAADLIDKGIYSYSENDDGFNGFMETISIVTRMIEAQCHKRDREACFSNIHRELLHSLADPSRHQRTTTHACFCLGYCYANSDNE